VASSTTSLCVPNISLLAASLASGPTSSTCTWSQLPPDAAVSSDWTITEKL